jgi:WD40 repeat protein
VEGAFPPVCLSPDGEKVAWAADDTHVTVLEVASGRTLYSRQLEREDKKSLRIFRLAFSPDAKSIAAASCLNESRSPGKNALPPEFGIDLTGTRREVSSDVVHILGASRGDILERRSRSTDWLVGTDWSSVAESKGLGRRALHSILSWNRRTANSRRTLKLFESGSTEGLEDALEDDFMPADTVYAVHPPSRLVARALYSDLTVRVCRVNGEGRDQPPDDSPAFAAAVIRGHTSPVTCMAFSTDGQRLVTADSQGDIMVWSDRAWRCAPDVEMRLSDPVAGGLLNRFNVDLASGLVLGTNPCAISGEGTTVALTYADPPGVAILDLRSGRMLRPWEEQDFENGGDGEGVALAVSNDARRVASADQKGGLRVRDATSGKIIWRASVPVEKDSRPPEKEGELLPFPKSPVSALSFSADAEFIVAASGSRLYYYEAETGRLAHSRDLTPPPDVEGDGPDLGPITDLIFSPDGKHLACGYDRKGVVAIASSDGGEVRRWVRGHGHSCFDASGAFLAAARGRDVDLWKVEDGERVANLKGRTTVASTAFSPDGTRLVTAGTDESLSVWEMPGGSYLASYFTTESPPWNVAEIPMAVAPTFPVVGFARDGQRLITVTRDGGVRVLNAARP